MAGKRSAAPTAPTMRLEAVVALSRGAERLPNCDCEFAKTVAMIAAVSDPRTNSMGLADVVLVLSFLFVRISSSFSDSDELCLFPGVSVCAKSRFVEWVVRPCVDSMAGNTCSINQGLSAGILLNVASVSPCVTM